MGSKGVKFKNQNGDIIFPCPYYPIGSIYMSVVNLNPSNYFGGTWEQIKDTFLLACGDTYSNGTSGGEAKHTLTAEELPVGVIVRESRTSGAGNTNWSTGITGWANYENGYGQSNRGKPHNNMPPYLAVYIWKRTA